MSLGLSCPRRRSREGAVVLLWRRATVEMAVNVLLCVMLIWTAVMIGLVVGWSWRPHWTGLFFLDLRPTGLRARKLWLAVFHVNVVHQAVARAAAQQATTMLGQQAITKHTQRPVEQHAVASGADNALAQHPTIQQIAIADAPINSIPHITVQDSDSQKSYRTVSAHES